MLLLTYRVKARNTATESENKIHDDVVASGYGFKGGLVPGVAVYAYMTAPIVSKYGMKWLEGGTMQMRFLKPVYDGDEIVVRAETQNNETVKEAVIRVERGDGSLCATGAASLGGGLKPLGEPRLEGFVDTPPPRAEAQVPAHTLECLGVLQLREDFADKRENHSTSSLPAPAGRIRGP